MPAWLELGMNEGRGRLTVSDAPLSENNIFMFVAVNVNRTLQD
jgi:hypothetical protein